MRHVSPRGQDGFTLAELLVAMTIFLLVLMGILELWTPSTAVYLSSQRRLDVQQNARVAMDVIVRQIRMAGYFPENVLNTDPADDVANPIQIATNTALAIAGNLDGVGATSSGFLFCYDGASLRRIKGALGVNATYQCSNGDILAESVTSLSFAYFDANNTPVPNPPTTPYQLDAQNVGAAPTFVDTTERSTVRRIVITLTARETSGSQSTAGQSAIYTLSSDVRLRNP
jgi:prepilin-type N-terminal cleavage/methylation domain-containing protein